MGTSSGANFHRQPPPRAQPLLQQHPRLVGQHPLALLPLDAAGHYPDPREPVSNSACANDSPSERGSSREIWPIETSRSDAVGGKKAEKEEGENELPQQQVIRRISTVDKLSIRDAVRERIETISERMMVMPDELLEELKSELCVILEGTGGPQHREELLNLQKVVLGRTDLTASALTKAHRVQLEILVAINTGIWEFMHPTISLPQSRLIEVFHIQEVQEHSLRKFHSCG